MNAQATTTIPVGSYVTSYAGNGYFVGVTGSQYVLNIGGRQVGIDPADANVTHVPGFMAENQSGEVRYFALVENAEAFSWTSTPVPALVPIGARLHDVFDSIADFDANNPALAAVEHLTLWSARRGEELVFASEDAAFSYSRDNSDCLTDGAAEEVFCHHPEH